MGSAQTYTAANLITEARYSLLDTDSKQYADAELLAYLNKWNAIVFDLLVRDNSDMVRTGTGTITTVAGTATYALSSSTMDDLWIPYRVWIAGYDAMTKINESGKYAYEQTDGSITTGRPDEYFIESGNITLLPEPDAVYTVLLKYYPNFIPLSATSSAIPYYGIFNRQLVSGMVFEAKGREGMNATIEAAMIKLEQDIAFTIAKRRQPDDYQFSPRFS